MTVKTRSSFSHFGARLFWEMKCGVTSWLVW